MLNGSEVAKHNSSEDLWMVIKGKVRPFHLVESLSPSHELILSFVLFFLSQVYDLTEFAPSHPGGIRIIHKYAGKDATEQYELYHAPGTLEGALSEDKYKGEVDMSTVEKVVEKEQKAVGTEVEGESAPTLAGCLNLDDIEKAAEYVHSLLFSGRRSVSVVFEYVTNELMSILQEDAENESLG